MRSKLDHPVFLAVLGAVGLAMAFTGAHPRTAPAPAAEAAPAAPLPGGVVAGAKRIAARFSQDRVMTEAAGVTFYALLAIFPALAALISIYGLVADPATVADQIAALSGVLPGGGLDILKDQVHALTSGPPKALGFGALFGIATSLWSANAGTKALVDALNVVNEEKERRGFIRLTATTLAFTVGALLFIVLALAAIVVVPVVLKFIGLDGVLSKLLQFARWPLLLLVVAGLLAVLYRFGPDSQHPKWRWISWGSAFSAIAWLLASAGFSWYVSNFGSYNKTYGSLGAVIGFMTWIWISTIVILTGAELNAELDRQTSGPLPQNS